MCVPVLTALPMTPTAFHWTGARRPVRLTGSTLGATALRLSHAPASDNGLHGGDVVTAILCAISKGGTLEGALTEKAALLMARYAPHQPLEVRTDAWIAPSRRLGAWRASAHTDWPLDRGDRIEQSGTSTCLWVSGYAECCAAEVPTVPDSQHQIETFCRQLSELAGVYSVFWLSDQLRALGALTNITRLEPVYWTETDEHVFVGNRALLVHLLAMNGATCPTYDPAALPAFLAGGFFASESVPFEGVRLLAPNSALSVTSGRTSVVEVSDALRQPGQRRFSPEALDELAAAFRATFASLRSHDAPITVALTGGKDSRLIVAGLKSAAVPFRTYIVDYGAANAADVAASAEVARRLGVEHEVRHRGPDPHAGSSLQRIDLLKIVRDTLFVTDGMLSGYENVPRRSCYSSALNLAGNGGELLRGGYAKTARTWTREEARTYLLETFDRFSSFVRNGLADGYRDFVSSWVHAQPRRLTGASLLDRFYLFYRCGRWSAAARAGYSLYQDLHQPLFDAQLIAQVQALPIEPRQDDRLNFELLRRLAPELLDLPFANKHWLFASAKQQQADRARFPDFYCKTDGSSANAVNLDWRTRFATQLREEFRQQVFHGPASDSLFEILDRDQLLGLFESPALTHPASKLFLFAAYTLSVLLSNDWLGPSREGRVVTVDPAAP